MSNYYSNKQELIMNNKINIFPTNTIDLNFFANKNIFTASSNCDSIIMNGLYKQISNPYQKKIDLINIILKSDIQLNIMTLEDLKKFFNWLAPLNNEYNFSSFEWQQKRTECNGIKRIIFQNAISKSDMCTFLYKNYIDLIKKKLKDSKLNYYYFELKNKRFNKIKDIIFVVDIDLLECLYT
jgi:hypothetical protein